MRQLLSDGSRILKGGTTPFEVLVQNQYQPIEELNLEAPGVKTFFITWPRQTSENFLDGSARGGEGYDFIEVIFSGAKDIKPENNSRVHNFITQFVIIL